MDAFLLEEPGLIPCLPMQNFHILMYELRMFKKKNKVHISWFPQAFSTCIIMAHLFILNTFSKWKIFQAIHTITTTHTVFPQK